MISKYLPLDLSRALQRILECCVQPVLKDISIVLVTTMTFCKAMYGGREFFAFRLFLSGPLGFHTLEATQMGVNGGRYSLVQIFYRT